MAILHGMEPDLSAPTLIIKAGWKGNPSWYCTECRLHVRADHRPGGEECRLLVEERIAKNRE